jgi:hypothetical protein
MQEYYQEANIKFLPADRGYCGAPVVPTEADRSSTRFVMKIRQLRECGGPR